MTLHDYIKVKFDDSLEEVKEQSPLLPFAEQVKLAKGMVIEDVDGRVSLIANQRLAAHTEGVSKAFFG